jgi:hypothetical protein
MTEIVPMFAAVGDTEPQTPPIVSVSTTAVALSSTSADVTRAGSERPPA